MATSSHPTLYERLGGVYRIATVVDDLIDRVMGDPRLNANPRVDEAHHRVSAAGFKYLVTEMVCWASGGPSSIADARCGSRTKISELPRPSGTPSWTTCSTRWIRSGSLKPSRTS
jgi:hypothetical protein